MSTLALLLVLGSAGLHALWNLLGKRVSPCFGYFWLANLTMCLLLLPFGIWWLSESRSGGKLPGTVMILGGCCWLHWAEPALSDRWCVPCHRLPSFFILLSLCCHLRLLR